MNINDYLKTHEMIHISCIERKIGLTKGTLKKGRDIPIKYVEAITNLLKDYGYLPSIDALQSTIIPKPIVTIQKTIEPVVAPVIKEETKQEIKTNDKYSFSGPGNRTCKYFDFKNIEQTVILTNKMIETGRIKGASQRTFFQFNDSRIFNCVDAYLKKYV